MRQLGTGSFKPPAPLKATKNVKERHAMPNAQDIEEIGYQVIGAAIEVHRELGPGLLESSYERCLVHELSLRGIKAERQKSQPIHYKGLDLDEGYRLDIIVE